MADIAWMNEDGTFTDDWLTNQPQEFQTEAALQDIKGMPGLMKAYLDTKKAMGARVALPKEGEEVSFYRKHLNAPEEAGQYQLEKPQNWPEGVPFDDGLVKAFGEAAVEAGMPKAMAQKVYNQIMAGEQERLGASLKQRDEAMGKAADASLKALKAAWGETDEKFNPNLELALRGFRNENMPSVVRQQVAKQLNIENPDDLKDAQIGEFLKKNAPLAILSANIGKLTANDRRVGGGTPGGRREETVEIPPFPKSPEMYRNYKEGDEGYKHKQWFMDRGYDYDTGTWNKG